MSTENTWFVLAIINFLGIAQGIFLAGILLSLKGNNRLANSLLAALLLCFAVGIAGATLGASGYYLQFPHLIRLGDPVVLLIGPLFYFYAKALTKTGIGRKDWLHFIPFVLYIVYLIPFYTQTGSQKVAFVQQMQESTSLSILFIVFLRSVFLLTYTLLTFRLLNTYTDSIKNTFSNIDKLNLDWIISVAKLLLVVIICSFVMYILIFTGNLSFLTSNYITAFLLTVVIYVLGILGIKQAKLFLASNQVPVAVATSVELEQPSKTINRYESSTLTAQKSEKYLQKLLHAMRQDKVYLNSDLSLQVLAEQLDIPPHYLSQVINEQLGQNFFDFVNTYRIEEVKARLIDPKNNHLTILAIAFDAGFSSKSAFNLAFKNLTGFTPSQFRAQHKSV